MRGQNDLDKVKRYLQKAVACDISKSTHWQYITDLKRLRNNIVHYDGAIAHSNGDFKALENFARKRFDLKNSTDCSYVRINEKKFLISSLEIVESFLIEVINWHIA